MSKAGDSSSPQYKEFGDMLQIAHYYSNRAAALQHKSLVSSATSSELQEIIPFFGILIILYNITECCHLYNFFFFLYILNLFVYKAMNNIIWINVDLSHMVESINWQITIDLSGYTERLATQAKVYDIDGFSSRILNVKFTTQGAV